MHQLHHLSAARPEKRTKMRSGKREIINTGEERFVAARQDGAF
jgi:hypothetical protein